MNKKVIKTSIALTIIFLVAWYILKIFFPEEFVLTINNPRLVEIGLYIDQRWIFHLLLGVVTSFITYSLYLCAVCRTKKLKLKQTVLVLVIILASFGIEKLFPTLITFYNILAMICLPALFGANLKDTAIVFTIHLLCQWLSLEIRGISTMIIMFNSLSLYVMIAECYFWLLLLYLLFNYPKKEET